MTQKPQYFLSEYFKEKHTYNVSQGTVEPAPCPTCNLGILTIKGQIKRGEIIKLNPKIKLSKEFCTCGKPPATKVSVVSHVDLNIPEHIASTLSKALLFAKSQILSNPSYLPTDVLTTTAYNDPDDPTNILYCEYIINGVAEYVITPFNIDQERN